MGNLFKLLLIITMYYSIANAQEYQVDQYTVGLYHLNETAGTIVNDESTNNNDGAIYGSAIWSDSGYFNNAIYLNGQTYVVIPDNESLDITDQLTLEAWIYFEEGGTSNPRIISKEGYSWIASENSYGLWTEMSEDLTGRFIRFFIQRSDLNGFVLQSKTKINKEIWYHIAGTYDGNHMKIFINGKLDTMMVATGNINISSTPVTIGRKYSPYDYW